jgi:cytoskeleton protein RodZ
MDRAHAGVNAEGRPATIGEILRQARLERGVSLADVENTLHVRLRYLQALELDDFNALPPSVYTRALVREYARFLGLDPSQVLDRSIPMRPEDRNPIRSAIRPLEQPPIVSLKAISTVVVLALCAGLLMYLYFQYKSFEAGEVEFGSRSVASEPPPAVTRGAVAVQTAFPVTPTPTVGPEPTPILGINVEARIVDRSWVQVWSDEQLVLAETMQPGATRTFTGNRSVRMRVGNAAGVDVTVNGTQQGRLGTAGQQLDASWSRD